MKRKERVEEVPAPLPRARTTRRAGAAQMAAQIVPATRRAGLSRRGSSVGIGARWESSLTK